MNEASDAYSSENLMRYHTALAFVDRLEAMGFLTGRRRQKYPSLSPRGTGSKKIVFISRRACYSGLLE